MLELWQHIEKQPLPDAVPAGELCECGEVMYWSQARTVLLCLSCRIRRVPEYVRERGRERVTKRQAVEVRPDPIDEHREALEVAGWAGRLRAACDQLAREIGDPADVLDPRERGLVAEWKGKLDYIARLPAGELETAGRLFNELRAAVEARNGSIARYAPEPASASVPAIEGEVIEDDRTPSQRKFDQKLAELERKGRCELCNGWLERIAEYEVRPCYQVNVSLVPLWEYHPIRVCAKHRRRAAEAFNTAHPIGVTKL